eukprot:m.27268 g.27268  ORF g.27268 m.27268 type:complete len:389 (+) comp5926_c0_seq2:110-1276(+)
MVMLSSVTSLPLRLLPINSISIGSVRCCLLQGIKHCSRIQLLSTTTTITTTISHFPDEAVTLTKRTQRILQGVKNGDRSALAQSITLVESTNKDKFLQGQALLSAIVKEQGPQKTIRVGISGPPGVGKSTFIEALGMHLVEHGHRVAVLTIDPSSSVSGGSILGDKTRMQLLSRHPNAYIRPSPSGCTLGGVARSTCDSIVLCEQAKYNVVLVETVGVGQSEIAVAGMTDIFLLLANPAGGDELQGIKRGVMELVDLVVVNKADGDLKHAAARAAAEYVSALKLLRRKFHKWNAKVHCVSSVKKTGMKETWDTVEKYIETVGDDALLAFRGEQYKKWMWRHIGDQLLSRFQDHAHKHMQLKRIEDSVKNGILTPGMAAESLLSAYFKD